MTAAPAGILPPPLPAAAAPPEAATRTERVLVLTPAGRDAAVAVRLLAEAGMEGVACADLAGLRHGVERGAGAVLLAEEAVATADLRALAACVAAQPPWSDLPFVLLTGRAGGAERMPLVTRLAEVLGSLAFLERPFHPITLVSMLRAALASRRRQYQARDALAAAALAADRLRASDERLRFAMLAARMGAWEFDPDTGRLETTEACRAVFGCGPRARFDRGDLAEAILPEDRALVAEAIARGVAGGDCDVEYRTLWPDGSVHWAATRGRLARDGDGTRRLVGVTLDVTARCSAEAELRRHRERLEELVAERTLDLAEANRRLRREAAEREAVEARLRQSQKMEAVGQLTGGIAHDFNNLLQAVLGSLELVRKRRHDPDQVAHLAEAGAEAARRGARLTAQLLAFSRTQALTLAPVETAALVRGMADLLARSIGPEVELALEPDPAAGSALADANQLELALLNLAINARDAMPGGGRLRIATSCGPHAGEADLRPGRYVTVAVTDTGTGMTPDVAERAFEPFFTTKEVGRGTGLGLSQVYGIARQSGGTVRLDTAPGQGTTVRVLLPAVAAGAAPEPEPAAEAEAAPPAAGLVLVVDDDAHVRRVLVEGLASLGYPVAEAALPRDGLAQLDRLMPACLVVDYAMPGMNGAEFAAEALRRRPGLRVVLATGHAETANPAARLEGAALLRKPFRLRDLADALARAVPARLRD